MFLDCCMDLGADRRNVYVDLRIHIPEKLLQLDGQTRTVLATNDYNHLKVYLYFSAPVLNSSAEIMSSLNISQGTLIPINGKNLSNQRFGFMVSFFCSSDYVIDDMYDDSYILKSLSLVCTCSIPDRLKIYLAIP